MDYYVEPSWPGDLRFGVEGEVRLGKTTHCFKDEAVGDFLSLMEKVDAMAPPGVEMGGTIRELQAHVVPKDSHKNIAFATLKLNGLSRCWWSATANSRSFASEIISGEAPNMPLALNLARAAIRFRVEKLLHDKEHDFDFSATWFQPSAHNALNLLLLTLLELGQTLAEDSAGAMPIPKTHAVRRQKQ